MPIRRKSSIAKRYYESIGQGILFGHDNLNFKTVNLPKKQHFKNICKKFSVKLIIQTKPIFLNVIQLY
ncbi:hypothetical protein IDH28_01160 [Pelagibacterales bacterium SAG-MED31]|nr:hypothetical protein [Pelagibacterales bacterium SAG-MED31]